MQEELPASVENPEAARSSILTAVRRGNIHAAILIPHLLDLDKERQEQASAIVEGTRYFQQELERARAFYEEKETTTGSYESSHPKMDPYNHGTPILEIVTPIDPFPQEVLIALMSSKKRARDGLIVPQPPNEVIALYILSAIASRSENTALEHLFFMKYPLSLHYGRELGLVFLPNFSYVNETLLSLFDNVYIVELFRKYGLSIKAEPHDSVVPGTMATISPVKELSNLVFDFHLRSEIPHLLFDLHKILPHIPYGQRWILTTAVTNMLTLFTKPSGIKPPITFRDSSKP
jgi:hypothetical protein